MVEQARQLGVVADRRRVGQPRQVQAACDRVRELPVMARVEVDEQVAAVDASWTGRFVRELLPGAVAVA